MPFEGKIPTTWRTCSYQDQPKELEKNYKPQHVADRESNRSKESTRALSPISYHEYEPTH